MTHKGRCQHCIDRHDGIYGSWAAPCPYHDDDGNPRIDAARAALASTGQAPAQAAPATVVGDAPEVLDIPDQCPYFGPSPHREVWLEGWYAACAAQKGKK